MDGGAEVVAVAVLAVPGALRQAASRQAAQAVGGRAAGAEERPRPPSPHRGAGAGTGAAAAVRRRSSAPPAAASVVVLNPGAEALPAASERHPASDPDSERQVRARGRLMARYSTARGPQIALQFATFRSKTRLKHTVFCAKRGERPARCAETSGSGSRLVWCQRPPCRVAATAWLRE